MVVMVLLCAFVASCTQTSGQRSAVSSYSGEIGTTVEAKRRAQIERARKRAKAASIKRQKAFEKKREASRKASAKTTKRSTKKRTRKPAAKSSSKRASKRKTLKTAAKKKKTSKTTRTSKGKVKKLKKSTAAFVGGRSRGIIYNAPWKCVPGRLKTVISQISRKFGKVVISSTHRSGTRNRKVGGKKRSYHLRCQAVDFRVKGKTKGLTRWLAKHPLVGGYKRYPAGHFHIDTGPRRTW